MVIVQGRRRLGKLSKKRIVRYAAYICGFLATVTMVTLQLVSLRHAMTNSSETVVELQSSPILQVPEEERRQALEYVNSFDSLGKQLGFFHIPKTAGTSIEHAAGKHEIPWGSCMFPHKPKRDICRYPSGNNWPAHVGWWHIPPFLFPLNNVDPYQNVELFGVIRDPYDRMESEYNYICSLKVFDWRPDQCNRTRFHDTNYMNEWIQDKLRQKQNNSYLDDNGHFTSQYDFIFGPNQVRMIDYVLKLENLGEPFRDLMQAFTLERVHLEKRNALGAAERKDSHSNALGDLTKSMVQKVYRDDFAFGGYVS